MSKVSGSIEPVVKTALCVIPPLRCWARLQLLRYEFDRAHTRWPPHVNVMYPFLPESEFEAAASQASKALIAMKPFEIGLDRFDKFDHGSSATLWLSPTPVDPVDEAAADAKDPSLESSKESSDHKFDDPWQRLYGFLLEAFPQCDHLRERGGGRYAPHASVGQLPSGKMAAAAAHRLQTGTEPPRRPKGRRAGASATAEAATGGHTSGHPHGPLAGGASAGAPVEASSGVAPGAAAKPEPRRGLQPGEEGYVPAAFEGAFEVGAVCLIARKGFEDPFSLRWIVPFGGKEPVRVGGEDAVEPAAGDGGSAAGARGESADVAEESMPGGGGIGKDSDGERPKLSLLDGRHPVWGGHQFFTRGLYRAAMPLHGSPFVKGSAWKSKKRTRPGGVPPWPQDLAWFEARATEDGSWKEPDSGADQDADAAPKGASVASGGAGGS